MKMLSRVAKRVSAWVSLAVALVVSLVVGTAPAFATSAFDITPITAAITDYGADAVLIVGAFILALWALNALGLLKRK